MPNCLQHSLFWGLIAVLVGCSKSSSTLAPAPSATTPVSDAAQPAAYCPQETETPQLKQIQLPAGFCIHTYAEDVPNARSMVLSPSGTVFVGTRDKGEVYALQDLDNDNRAEKRFTIAKGLRMPNGVALRQGALYVAEISRILRFDDIEAHLDSPPAPAVVQDNFPTDQAHGWKFIAFSPDDWLYVPVGAPCNICESSDPRYASIMRMRPDGQELQVYASGIRNTVGFAWHPETKELWFTDNGRDEMGDDVPPDELNWAPHAGMNFGYPYCHGNGIADPQFGSRHGCSEFVAPAIALGPHVAALGMRFYTGSQFPAPYRGQIFIAEHGSWNRSTPIGYRITLVRRSGNQATRYEVFAQGWLQGTRPWGRPVDVLQMPDGALLVSDDYAGKVYRIAYAP